MAKVRTYRKCHVCDRISEADGEIRRCDGCGRAFAPFYYFEDRSLPILSVGDPRPEVRRGPEDWPPVRGLTAYWSAE